MKFSRVRFHFCQDIEFVRYETKLHNKLSYKLKWALQNSEEGDFMVIIMYMWLSPFPGQWLVAGPGMDILVYINTSFFQ